MSASLLARFRRRPSYAYLQQARYSLLVIVLAVSFPISTLPTCIHIFKTAMTSQTKLSSNIAKNKKKSGKGEKASNEQNSSNGAAVGSFPFEQARLEKFEAEKVGG